MKVIINADDFGHSKGITDGIIYAFKNGVVTSTTAMCNMPYIEYARDLANENKDLGIGIHLTLTVGKSLTKNKTLVDENGYFYKSNRKRDIDETEVYDEYKAQIEKFIKVFGKLPTHIDSHHHFHDMVDLARDVVIKLSEEYGLKVRSHNEYKFVVDFYDKGVSIENLKNILLRNENIEIMCHPAIIDLDLYKSSSYCFERIKELDILCSEEIKEFIKDNNIELTHY